MNLGQFLDQIMRPFTANLGARNLEPPEVGFEVDGRPLVYKGYDLVEGGMVLVFSEEGR